MVRKHRQIESGDTASDKLSRARTTDSSPVAYRMFNDSKMEDSRYYVSEDKLALRWKIGCGFFVARVKFEIVGF